MNRWLIPCLVIGLVSTIALSTLLPLVPSFQVIAKPVEPTASSPNHVSKLPLPTAMKPSVARPTPVRTPVCQLHLAESLAQFLAPAACHVATPSAGPIPPAAQTEGAMPPTAMTSRPEVKQVAVEFTVAALINHQREQIGLAPLTLVPLLTQAAYLHSVDMGQQAIPTHQGTDGSSGGERMLSAGYPWQGWAEVIGWGFTEPSHMVEWWLNHAEHRAILLSPAFTEFGIGYVVLSNTPWQSYWTINFGQPDQSRPQSAPVALTTPLVDEPLPAPIAVTPVPLLTQREGNTPSSGSLDGCPVTSSQNYTLIPMTGVDLSHPAPLHADLNLAQRGYEVVSIQPDFTDLAGPTDDDAPQLAQLFVANHSIHLTALYQVHDWDWQCGEHGCRRTPLTTPASTMLGLQAEPGTPLRSPARRGSIYRDSSGSEYVAVVLYAEAHRLTLAYTRDGSVAQGYVVHLEQLCVDPMLVQRYTKADRDGRQQLPALRHNQTLGVARAKEVGVAIRDRGTFLDPRSRKDWWRGF